MDCLAHSVCQLNVLLDLDNLATRRFRRRRRTARTEFLILARLLHAPKHALPQVDLADLLQLSVSQVQKVTESLSADGLLEREQDAAPRGGVLLKLTDRGKRKVVADVAAGAKEFAVFDIVWESDDERQMAVKLLQRAADYIRQHVEAIPGMD